jgi:serine/threonine-protein kinase
MIELRCLGSIDLRSPERGPTTRVIAQPKRYALLAYLVLANPRGFHRRDALISLFWPESDDEHARTGLRIALSFLRRELGDDVIITRGDDVAVKREAVRCDVDEFESALNTGDLERALSLYHGDLLPGFHVSMSAEFERWLEGERERLRQRAHDAALKLSASHEGSGDWEGAIKWLRFALNLAPDDEAAVQRVIRLFDRAGDRAGALRTYEAFAQRMTKEFEAEPSPETQALVAGIRARSTNAPSEIAISRARGPNAAVPLEFNPESEPTDKTKPIEARPMFAERRGVTLAIVSAAGLMLLALSTIHWRSPRASATPSVATDSSPSLAVLPFENLGKNDDAYFAVGMTDEISSKLGALAGVTLIGRQSAKSYANSDKPTQQIGKELGATYLLTGTVRWDRSRAGRNLVRVTPVLLRASDGAQIWSQPYQGEATNVFDIQEKIAGGVVSEMRLNLSRSEKQSLTTRPTNSTEAYDYFLRARSLGSTTHYGSDLLRSVAFLERAVQTDPKFALAHAELGTTHLLVHWFVADDDPRRLEMAKAAIDTALALDSRLAAAHLANATYYYRAKRDFKRALDALAVAERLSPNDPDVLILKGAIEKRQNRWADAIADQERAFRLDPRNDRVVDNLCFSLVWIRRYDEADKVCGQLVAIAPEKWLGYSSLYRVATHRGDVKGALEIVHQAERRVVPEEFAAGLLEDGGWPAFLDPHLLSIMESVPPPAGPESRVGYYSFRLYLSVYKKDRAAARRFGDSVLVYGQRVLTGTWVDAGVHGDFAMAYAAKGDNRRRLEHAELTMKAVPISMDAATGTANACNLVNTAVLAGAYDEAITRLKQVLAIPSGISVGLLRVDPWFDPLRRDPRFQQLLANYD